MGDNSAIEWTEATWNPVTGCTKVSPGCDHCYAERIVERFHGKGSFAVVQRSEEKLYLPLRWRKPRRIFVNSMSDLFHDDVPDSFIARVFSVMAATPHHTYQLLTKRHGRMHSLIGYDGIRLLEAAPTEESAAALYEQWPLPNVWLGVSVEDQKRANLRIDALADTPAAVRWLSMEPLLGPVDLSRWLTQIDWVVVGGESGPGARPMHPDWVRSLRDQCTAAGVPFFFKQWGEWQDGSSGVHVSDRDHVIVADGRHEPWLGHTKDAGQPATPLALARYRNEPGTHRAVVISRVGKKAAGRVLDEQTWDQYPEGAQP